jgi:predicted AAA+ superfamily ATPase
VDWKREKVFLFLDEVQKLPGWQDEVKIIYDNFPCIKMVLSGSSSLWLEKDAIKALAGRHFSVDVKPLGFGEFLSLKGKAEYAEKPALWERELRREFALYLKRPFPETAAWDNEILLRKYVREMVLDKVLRSDLPEKFTDANPGILMRLVETFYSQPGMSVNYERLAADMKISKATLASHVFYLELAYLIRRVRNFRSRQATASRKMQKIYPYHWGLVYSVGEPEVSESFVASIIDAKYYWREGKREIDFVHNGKDILPIEVKSGGVKSGDLDSIAHFCGRRRLHRAMVVYNGAEKSGKAGDTEIRFLPFWKFALSPARLL